MTDDSSSKSEDPGFSAGCNYVSDVEVELNIAAVWASSRPLEGPSP